MDPRGAAVSESVQTGVRVGSAVYGETGTAAPRRPACHPAAPPQGCSASASAAHMHIIRGRARSKARLGAERCGASWAAGAAKGGAQPSPKALTSFTRLALELGLAHALPGHVVAQPLVGAFRLGVGRVRRGGLICPCVTKRAAPPATVGRLPLVEAAARGLGGAVAVAVAVARVGARRQGGGRRKGHHYGHHGRGAPRGRHVEPKDSGSCFADRECGATDAAARVQHWSPPAGSDEQTGKTGRGRGMRRPRARWSAGMPFPSGVLRTVARPLPAQHKT